MPPSETGDSHTPVSDQGECPPPPLALTAQDSVPQLATHSGGHCARRGGVAFLCPLEGMFSRRPWPFLRFRTNDVLLGTSGVGCAYLWCLIPSVMCYGYRFAEWTLLQPFDLRLPTSAGRLPMVEWLPDRIGDYDPYNFFSHLAGPIFAQMHLRIRTRVLTLSAWCASVFRHCWSSKKYVTSNK